MMQTSRALSGMEPPAYQPRPEDFQPAPKQAVAATLLSQRPSLSYWQDAWLRLKRNRRALTSLGIIIGLLLFTLAGPLLWSIDPATQDLGNISRGPSLGQTARVVADTGQYQQRLLADFPAYPDAPASSLSAPLGLALMESPTTLGVRLQWQPVEGASGYLVYRNNRPPEHALDLGLPLARISAANRVSYEDRLQLQAREYHYSILAVDGRQESPASTLAVNVEAAVTVEEAAQLGLGELQPGDQVRLGAHPFGTDYLGRDLLSRVMHGARVSLFIGLVAPLIFVLLGTLYGGIAGYFGGGIDNLMMRFADFVLALPFLLFMILFKIAFGIGPGESGIVPMMLALILLRWPDTARVVRGQVLQVREEAYVQAARLLGARPGYLILRHMLPNTLGAILVTLTFAVPMAIFTEAFLSFIGMGVVPPTPSWGSMSNDGLRSILTRPHELFFPALFISISVLAFNLLGDGLRDALDARLRSRD